MHKGAFFSFLHIWDQTSLGFHIMALQSSFSVLLELQELSIPMFPAHVYKTTKILTVDENLNCSFMISTFF